MDENAQKSMDGNTQNGCLGCGCLTLLLVCFLMFGASFGNDIPAPKPTPSPSPTIVSPKPPSKPPRIIDPAPESAEKTWELQIIDVEHPGKKLQWSDYGKIEEASGTWLVVHISLKNTAKEKASIHPSNFRVIDLEGQIYDHYKDFTVTETYELYRGGQRIVNKIIEPSAKANCYLLFDISSDATGLKLDFKPDVFAKSEVITIESWD